MGKEKISHKIEIRKPPSEVFNYLKKIEPRLRINPAYRLLNFEWLTEGPIGEGTRYRVTARIDEGVFTYVGIVKELEENKKIVTEDSEGKLRVTFILNPTSKGTELNYIEEFELSDEVLFKEESKEKNLLSSILTFFFKTGGFCQNEVLRRRLKLLEELNKKALYWLEKLREDIEAWEN